MASFSQALRDCGGDRELPVHCDGDVRDWLQSWFVAWMMMLPIVLFAAPVIRNLTPILTREDANAVE